MPRPTASNVLGGPFNGYSAPQTVNSFKTCEDASVRTLLRRGWNTAYANGTYNGHKRVITPFRAVNNSGDFLARQNYVCGGPNPSYDGGKKPGYNMGGMFSVCDGTGVPASACNTKFVADSSEYIRFRKQRAYNHVYNDVTMGGFQNSSQSALRRVRS